MTAAYDELKAERDALADKAENFREGQAEAYRQCYELGVERDAALLASAELQDALAARLAEAKELLSRVGQPTSYDGDDDSVGFCSFCGKRFEHEDACVTRRIRAWLDAEEQ